MTDVVDLIAARQGRADWDLRGHVAAVLAGLVLLVGGSAGLLLAAGGAFVVVQTLRMGAGPVALMADSTAVTLRMPRGRSRVYRWSDPSTTVILVDLRKSPQATEKFGQRRPYVARRTGLIWLAPRPHFDITPRALEEILSAAAAAGRLPRESEIRFGSFSAVRRIELSSSLA
jgi:hypothetical protein